MIEPPPPPPPPPLDGVLGRGLGAGVRLVGLDAARRARRAGAGAGASAGIARVAAGTTIGAAGTDIGAMLGPAAGLPLLFAPWATA
jgi:hypothetical protein